MKNIEYEERPFEYIANHMVEYEEIVKWETENFMTKWNVPIITEILKHFECPDSCKAHCCKREKINVQICDINKLLYGNKDDESVTNTILNINGKMYRHEEDGNEFISSRFFLNKPCQFLDNDKCSVHNDKPMTCSIYPFTFKDDDNFSAVYLEQCPLAIKIFNHLKDELFEIQKDAFKNANFNDYEIAQRLREYQNKWNEWVKSSKNFYNGDYKPLGLNVTVLFILYNLLNNK